jgi:hypothetical protein
MKVKMNFKVDTLTLNGHIYPKEVLKKALDERKDKGNFFIYQCNSYKIEDIFAEVIDYKIKPSSEILVDIKFLNTPVVDKFKEGKFELTIFGVGIFEDDKKTISKDFKISHLYVVRGDENERI